MSRAIYGAEMESATEKPRGWLRIYFMPETRWTIERTLSSGEPTVTLFYDNPEQLRCIRDAIDEALKFKCDYSTPPSPEATRPERCQTVPVDGSDAHA